MTERSTYRPSAETVARAKVLMKAVWDWEVVGGLTLYDRGIIEYALREIADADGAAPKEGGK